MWKLPGILLRVQVLKVEQSEAASLFFVLALFSPIYVSISLPLCNFQMDISFNIQKSNGAIKLKDSLWLRMGINITERMHLVSDIIPSWMLILERCLSHLELMPNMVGSYIFFGAIAREKVKAHLHNLTFQYFSFYF